MEISLLDGQAFEVRKCLSFGILCGSGLVSSSALLGYWVDLSVWFVGVIVFVFVFVFVCFLFVSNTALQSLFFYTFFSFFFLCHRYATSVYLREARLSRAMYVSHQFLFLSIQLQFAGVQVARGGELKTCICLEWFCG